MQFIWGFLQHPNKDSIQLLHRCTNKLHATFASAAKSLTGASQPQPPPPAIQLSPSSTPPPSPISMSMYTGKLGPCLHSQKAFSCFICSTLEHVLSKWREGGAVSYSLLWYSNHSVAATGTFLKITPW